MTIDDIKNMLEEGFKLDHCEVINESPNHSNYSGDLSHIKIIIELKISLEKSLRLFKGNNKDKFNLKEYARKAEPTHSIMENISFIKPLKVPTAREKINIPTNKKSIQFKEIFPSRISIIDFTLYKI